MHNLFSFELLDKWGIYIHNNKTSSGCMILLLPMYLVLALYGVMKSESIVGWIAVFIISLPILSIILIKLKGKK